jgi:hypothetical protein
MTTDPNSWFLTSQALDHRATVEALAAALRSTAGEDIVLMALDPVAADQFASNLSASLARAGFALVQLTPGREDRATDLASFLSRKED